MYVDISVKNFSAAFTKKAKPFDVTTQIILKVPAWDLTTVRLTGTLLNLTEFMRSLTLPMDSTWTEATVRLHVNAAKPVEGPVVHWKNRQLMEHRNA